MANDALRRVFEPQTVPDDYMRRAAIRLVLRPKTFHSNALDLAQIERFITAQVPHYVELVAPTVIITGDADTMVSPQINARALAATLPGAKLVLLKDIGHMPHHAAPDVVAGWLIDELVHSARRRMPRRSAKNSTRNFQNHVQASARAHKDRDRGSAVGAKRSGDLSVADTLT